MTQKDCTRREEELMSQTDPVRSWFILGIDNSFLRFKKYKNFNLNSKNNIYQLLLETKYFRNV